MVRHLGINPTEIRLTGGGSKSAIWRKILADIFNTEVVAMADSEGAAFGAALQARWAFAREKGEKLSLEALAENWVKTDETTRAIPDPKNAALYKELQNLHNELSLSLRKVFTSHRKILL